MIRKELVHVDHELLQRMASSEALHNPRMSTHMTSEIPVVVGIREVAAIHLEDRCTREFLLCATNERQTSPKEHSFHSVFSVFHITC